MVENATFIVSRREFPDALLYGTPLKCTYRRRVRLRVSMSRSEPKLRRNHPRPCLDQCTIGASRRLCSSHDRIRKQGAWLRRTPCGAWSWRFRERSRKAALSPYQTSDSTDKIIPSCDQSARLSVSTSWRVRT